MWKKSRLKIQFFVVIVLVFLFWVFSMDFYWFLLIKLVEGSRALESAEFQESVSTDILFYMGSVVLLFVGAIPFICFFMKEINRPISETARKMKELALGNYSLRMNIKNSNEFAEIADAFNYMASQLEEARRVTENAEKERTMLFANMAHDLKTPITSILGCSKALADGMVESEQKRDDYINAIWAKAIRMNELVDRLFEYAKLESPENILHKTDADVAELLRGCVANMYDAFEEKGIRLEINIPEKPVTKCVDALEIDRVFTNLLSNAVKHNPGGTTVSVFMEESGETVISDTGAAIPKSVSEQMFKPFVLGDESRRSKGGSGLGLALSHKIMLRHGGKLRYEEPCTGRTKGFVVEF